MLCASFLTDPLTLTWKKLATGSASRIACNSFGREVLVQALCDARNLTRLEPTEFFPELTRMLAAAGVAVVLVPELKGQRASCAHGWLTPEHAYIATTLRYRREDHFWFSLYHAACHLVLSPGNSLDRGERSDTGAELPKPDEQCAEASRLAADLLIPPQLACRLPALRTAAQIETFAKCIWISPGIVVGRMQYEGLLRYSEHVPLKRKLDFTAALAAQEAVAATWVSVAGAAVELMGDLPHVHLAQAKVMVSRAASRGDVCSNGQVYQKRRLEPNSLAAWRLAMRDRDLDAEDAA